MKPSDEPGKGKEKLSLIRLRQQPMTSEELVSQMRNNRTSYASRLLKLNGKRCGDGRKAVTGS